MPAAKRNALTEAFFGIHPWIYQKTGGRVLGQFGNSNVLLLTTQGRKSGEPRTNGLLYLEHANGWAVAASWAGEPKHPFWYLNLAAQPEATIQIRDQQIPVRARELEGDERALVWKKLVAQDPGFAVYEERTRGIRDIPVVLLERIGAQSNEAANGVHVLYGLSCSYFTGKLEAYLQTKGIPFRFVEMSRGQFQACAEATGVVQLPCIQTPDGSWLTDTTAILQHFEAQVAEPRLRPVEEATAFCSLLLEDFFDEWFWRPALYYRWAFDEDAKLMSHQLARTLLRDVPLPMLLRRRFLLHRQRAVFLKKDGVTKKTAPTIEALYIDSLRELDAIFRRRPFLFGDRPCEADFGLFGPFFRHFFCDPTPGALMRERAPHVAHWVTRLWKLRPGDLNGAPEISKIPDDLGFFFRMIADEYLPYLEANSLAVTAGKPSVNYHAGGVDWQIPSAPYRAECLNELRRGFANLAQDARLQVADRLPERGINILNRATTTVAFQTDRQGRRGRLGRPAAVFD